MKKYSALLVCLALMVGLAACGSNLDDKVKSVQTGYAELVTQFNEALVVFEDAQERGNDLSQLVGEYNQISDYINEFGAMELDGMSSDDLDTVLEQIDQMKAAVNKMNGALGTL